MDLSKTEASLEDTSAAIEVWEEGVGIAEENLDLVFESFGRVKCSKAENPEGTGSGLAISRRLIDAYGGSPKVLSRLGEVGSSPPAGLLVLVCHQSPGSLKRITTSPVSRSISMAFFAASSTIALPVAIWESELRKARPWLSTDSIFSALAGSA